MKYFKTYSDLLYILRIGIGSSFRASYTCHVFQMASRSVLCHYNRHLMGHFEFIYCCLPLSISEKSHWQHVFEKLRDSLIAIFVNMIQHPCILKNKIDLSSKLGLPSFFHSHNKPALGRLLLQYVDKTLVLVVTVEFIWLLLLNILYFNFFQTPSKSFKVQKI